MKRATPLLRWALRRSWRGLGVSTLSGLAYQSGLILLPWCLERALDDGITAGERSAVVRWALAVVAVSVVLVLAEAGMRWFAALVAARTGNELTERLMHRVLTLDRSAVGRFEHGDLVVRGTRDVTAVTDLLRGFGSLVSGLVGVTAVIVVLTRLDPLLAGLGLATLPPLIAINLWYPRRFARANERVSRAHGDRANAVEDLLSAGTAVRGLGGETVLVRRHHVRSAEVTESTLALARVAAGWSAHAPFVPWLATGVGVAVGGLAVLDGRFSVGGLVAFASWMALLARQVMMLTARFNQVAQAHTAAGRIGEVLHTEPAVVAPMDPKPMPPRGEFVARGLAVELAGRPTLNLPELRVEPGELVAVTGPVGSGKSTLLRLCARLADASRGAVSYGGVDVRDADLGRLRDTVTLVPQRPVLLSGTVAENLRLGRAGIDEVALLAACRVAAIDPHDLGGLDAVLEERGGNLSGGQIQRLALARGLLRGARVLLLDDVTSAVDATTERRILERLRAYAPDVAIVMTTSRAAVMAVADRVIHLTDDDDDDAPGRPAVGEPDLVGGGRG